MCNASQRPGRATEQTLGGYSQAGPRKRLAEKYSQTIVVGEVLRGANVFQIGKAHSQVDPGAREGQGQIYQGETIKASQLGSAQDSRRMLEDGESSMAGEQ